MGIDDKVPLFGHWWGFFRGVQDRCDLELQAAGAGVWRSWAWGALTPTAAGLRGLMHSCSPRVQTQFKSPVKAEVVSRQSTFVQTQSHSELWPLHGQRRLRRRLRTGPGPPVPLRIAAPSISREINPLPQVKHTTARALCKALLPPEKPEMLGFFRMSSNRNFKNVENK